ncbi:hypothetical protein BGZ94_007429 [Podila epigama]|nr:hypothetical protein BGZ94_007429 [Podila epigama]
MISKLTTVAILATVFFSAASVSALPVDTAAAKCPDACPFIYDPICASSKTGTQTFSNACVLNAHNCKNPTDLFSVLSKGECKPAVEECNKACTREYNPVCGTSKTGALKTFSNDCVFKVHNCENPTEQFTILNKGECKPAPEKCLKACTMDYRPVCGTSKNGTLQTFGNSCSLEVYNCENPSNQFTVMSQGECKPVPEKCEKACTKDYRPVCGTSKSGALKTFGNECTFKAHNCENPTNAFTLLSQGECKAVTDECPNACTKDYRPVCGSSKNGLKTFGNLCMFKAHNCKNADNSFTVLYNGECKA